MYLESQSSQVQSRLEHMWKEWKHALVDIEAT